MPDKNGHKNVPPAEADPKGQRRTGSFGSASSSSGSEPKGTAPKIVSLGGAGVHSLLERKAVERTQVNAAADAAERGRVERDQQKLRDGHEEEVPRRHGGFHFRHKAKDEKRVLIVEKKEHSAGEQIITEEVAKLHRIARSDQAAEEAFDQLLQIHDLGGLEDIFSEEMQGNFRQFMMDWKLGLLRPHTKMRIHDTTIPWVGTTPARTKLTKCKKCGRICSPHCCCGKVVYSADLSTVQSLETFESMSYALTNSPSLSPLAMKAKRLRDELFDPKAPAWIYERELGVLMRGPKNTKKRFYYDEDGTTYHGSAGYGSGTTLQTLGRQDERAGESRLPRRGISFYVSLKPSKISMKKKSRAAISAASKISKASKIKSSVKKKKE